jgi:hypothetical protein
MISKWLRKLKISVGDFDKIETRIDKVYEYFKKKSEIYYTYIALDCIRFGENLK